jgi:CopG family nickel-responsive transcriptional regulator
MSRSPHAHTPHQMPHAPIALTNGKIMERFTISLEADLAEEFDRLIRARGYQNRSEAMRDILRQHIEQQRLKAAQAPNCVANVSYVYSHHERALADRVVDLQHQYHDLTIATMHAHLDHDQCIESLLLKGPTEQVRACADRLMAERGVRHGALNLVPVDVKRHTHSHDGEHGSHHEHSHSHSHTRPKS